jgi:RNA polymerase sigma-B factor
LQTPRSADDGEQTLQDTLGCSDDGFQLAESRVLLEDLGAGLAPRTREVLRLRFREDLTQVQIGNLMGVSQMQVSRIIHAALAQMRLAAAA